MPVHMESYLSGSSEFRTHLLSSDVEAHDDARPCCGVAAAVLERFKEAFSGEFGTDDTGEARGILCLLGLVEGGEGAPVVETTCDEAEAEIVLQGLLDGTTGDLFHLTRDG